MDLFAFLTVVLLAGGWIYAEVTYPDTIPLQVIRFTPPPLPEDPQFVRATSYQEAAAYDRSNAQLVISVRATNLGDSPMTLNSLTTFTLTFVNQATGTEGEHRMVVEPEGAIAANETRALKLTIRDRALEEARLLPLGETQMIITGVLTFENSQGQRNRITVQTPFVPSEFKTLY